MGPPPEDRRQSALGRLHMFSDDILCRILSLLSPKDIGSLACVSSVFNIFCNEEPLWMQLCLEAHQGRLDYKGTWKQTFLAKIAPTQEATLFGKPHRKFEGFNSLFLYRRWYRCHVALEGFAKDNGAVDRRSDISLSDFCATYDGKKPVLLTDLMKDWPARTNWSLEQLTQKCGVTELKVSQPHGKAIAMKLKDFADYMAVQHDEEPLYIFDPKFGELVPELLNDYSVPALFSDDLFSVLSESERPPFRWLVLGPARSGASWHVDPSLTSAWNSLLSGRKRWALYPPGKVPPGVTVDVDEDDGSVDYDAPTSLQWWLDVYPHLDDCDKPLECTQLPGETIYVPSGWWHCVLNVDTSVAVTQNFVNVNNLEVVCMDFAPGYRHRAVARAGKIALDGRTVIHAPDKVHDDGHMTSPIFAEIQKRAQSLPPINLEDVDMVANAKVVGRITDPNLLLAMDTLKLFAKEAGLPPGEADTGRKMGESMMRTWLRNLWVSRPELQETIWKGACLAYDAGTWLHRIKVICHTCGIPGPTDEEQLPVGDGKNPVYLIGDHAIKLYIQEAGPAASIDGLGSELNFYAILKESGSAFQDVVPEVVASGILYPDGEDYTAVPWDGTGDCSLVYTEEISARKKRKRDSVKVVKDRFRTKWAANAKTFSSDLKTPLSQYAELWPYLVTKRCPGRIMSEVHEKMTGRDLESLAVFLGSQIRLIHTLPLPAIGQTVLDSDSSERSFQADSDCFSDGQVPSRESKRAKCDIELPLALESSAEEESRGYLKPLTKGITDGSDIDAAVIKPWKLPKVWEVFVSFLRMQRRTAIERLKQWGSIPDHLLGQVETFLPEDPVVLVDDIQVVDGVAEIARLPVWLHNDLMLDNILVEELAMTPVEAGLNSSDGASDQQLISPFGIQTKDRRIQARYIIDFGDLLYGDPLYEILAPFLDLFKLEPDLLKMFLKNYRRPLSNSDKGGVRTVKEAEGAVETVVRHKLSYCAMCYCLLHDLDLMSVIFNRRRDVTTAKSFEQIADKVFGFLDFPTNFAA